MRLSILVVLSSLLAVGAVNGTIEEPGAAQYAERSFASRYRGSGRMTCSASGEWPSPLARR
jgi:hypothetical protein